MNNHWGVDYAEVSRLPCYFQLGVGGRAVGKSRRIAAFSYIEELRDKGTDLTAEELVKIYEYDILWCWNSYEYLIPATGKPPFIERGKLEVIGNQ